MPPLVPALLAALCVVTVPQAQCADTQQQQQQQTVATGLHITPDELWQLIDRAVAAATQPLTIKLDSRIDTMDTRLDFLDTRLDTLVSRLDTPNTRVDTLDSRLVTLDARLDTLDARLDVLDSRVDDLTEHRRNQDAQLASFDDKLDNHTSQLEETAKQLDTVDSRLNGLDSQANQLEEHRQNQESEMASMDDKLDNHTVQLEGTAQQLAYQKVQLQGQESRLDVQQSRLDEQASRLTEHNFEIVGQASRIDSQKSRLDNHTTEITTYDALLDAHSSQIDGQQSQLDALLNKTETQRAQIYGNTIRLNSFQTRSNRRDCSDLPEGSLSGVHLLQLGLDGTKRVSAYCDMEMDGGGWTVIQRRADIQPREDFYRGWASFKEGFGDLDKEFWWGLENTWAMVSPRDRLYELRIDLEDFDGERRHATYQSFRISSESDKYRLRIGNYTGDAGDSLTYHNGMRFTTKDRDYDESTTGNCAQERKGGWWYNACQDANLNGLYRENNIKGINWYRWRGTEYSLKTTTMKIRPTRKSLSE